MILKRCGQNSDYVHVIGCNSPNNKGNVTALLWQKSQLQVSQEVNLDSGTFIIICSTLRGHIKGAACSIFHMENNVLHFPVVGKYRIVACKPQKSVDSMLYGI